MLEEIKNDKIKFELLKIECMEKIIIKMAPEYAAEYSQRLKNLAYRVLELSLKEILNTVKGDKEWKG